MSAHHEELEEIENVKYYWKRGGKWLFLLIVVGALGYLGYTMYRNHQANQNAEAALAASRIQTGDTAALQAIQQNYPSSTAATQATLTAAAQLFADGKNDDAIKAYQWVLNNQKADVFKVSAALNLANVYLQQQKYDDAIKAVTLTADEAYRPLLDERKGDIYAAQGKTKEATDAYKAALNKLPENDTERQVIQFKAGQL